MKRILFPAIALLLTIVGCTGKKEAPKVDPKPIDTIVADWDENSIPMPIQVVYQLDESKNINNYDEAIIKSLRHVFDSQQDSALYSPIASTYKTLVSSGKSRAIQYSGPQQNAKEIGSIISGKYAYCMKGLNYESTGEFEEGFAFNEAFMNTHDFLELTYPETKAPQNILDSLRTRYNNDVKDSYTCAVSTDNSFSLYSVQMQPKDGKCLGMRVVNINDTLYIHEEWCEEYNDMSAWHVDDEGEYYPLSTIAVTKGEKGYDIFYYEGAPESSTYAALLLRNGKFENYDFACYYHAIDYTPTPDPVALPEGSELKAELDGYKVWVHTDVEQTEECEEGKFSVYYSEPESEDVYLCVTSNYDPKVYDKWSSNDVFVEKDEVMIASDVYLVKHPKWDNYYLILEGCPDSRNIFTYVSYLPIRTIDPSFRWMHTGSGFHGLDDSGQLLKFYTARYHEEGGRYEVCLYYDFNFDLVKEEIIEGF